MVKLQWICACGQQHDAEAKFKGRTHKGRALPQPGDVMLCIGCGEPFAFQDGADPIKLPWSALVQLLQGHPEQLKSFTVTRALIRSMA